jgi:hypothetical protein
MNDVPPALLREGAFSGPTEFANLVRDALACAARDGWAQMVWSDASFYDWPLREKAVVESLHAWARGGRKLLLLARSFDSLPRYHPRFVQWRVTWDHLVECRVSKHSDATDFPSALWSPKWSMRRLDLVRSSGFAGSDPQRRVALQEVLEEFKRHSSPGFPASVLGL